MIAPVWEPEDDTASHDQAADYAPRSIQSTDGVVSWPDGTEFVNVTNRCCGSPYPIAVLPSGAEHCAGCTHTVAPTVEAERALDEDADMYFGDRP